MTRNKRNKDRRLLLVGQLFLIFSLILMGCTVQQDSQSDDQTEQDHQSQEKLRIYTTVYPVHFFAQQIAGDRAEVKSLIPSGAEPHDFEPTAKDIIELSKADLFVYNGGGFEAWIEKIVESVNSETMVWVDSTANISLLTNEETGHIHDDHDDEAHGKEEDHDHDHDHEAHGKEEEHDHDHDHEAHGKEEEHDHDHDHEAHGKEEEHDHDHDHEAHGKEEEHDHDHDHEAHGKEEEHDHDHDHNHGEFDPHVWLDPQLAKLQAEEIKNALVQLDPEHASYYEANFQQLALSFDELDSTFRGLTEHVKRKDFIVSHAAYGYLANRYGFNQISISGLNPSSEPSPRQLQEIIEFAKENDVQYILFENMVSTKVAEVVRDSVGAEALVLHNLEVLSEEEISQGQNYFTLMEQNIEVLKKALGYE